MSKKNSQPRGYDQINNIDTFIGACMKKDGTEFEHQKVIVKVLKQFGMIDPEQTKNCACGGSMTFRET